MPLTQLIVSYVNLFSGVYQYFILVSSNLVNSNHIHLDFSLFPPSRNIWIFHQNPTPHLSVGVVTI